MKKLLIYSCLALGVFCITFSACSKGEDVESEKGKIEKMTDHAADVVVEKIRTPIEKARSARDMEEERMKAVDETLSH